MKYMTLWITALSAIALSASLAGGGSPGHRADDCTNVPGAVVGGVAGGAVGSQFGSGRGRGHWRGGWQQCRC